jgi:ubiquinone/menaquinone biosynthesis C-methylase UbiE
LARRLAGRYRVTAVDVDSSDLGLGGIRDDRVFRLGAEVEALPLRAAVFDVVIAAATLHYAVDVQQALAEIAWVLRPGGALIVADSPVYSDAEARKQAWQRTLAYYSNAGAAHLASRYRGLLRSELSQSGLFRFVTLSPGFGSWGGVLACLRGREAGAQMPVFLGRKR